LTKCGREKCVDGCHYCEFWDNWENLKKTGGTGDWEEVIDENGNRKLVRNS